MSKFVVIFCFLILGFVENNAYSQKQTVTTTPFRQISDIKKAGQLIIGMTKADYPPWYSGDVDNIHGLDVDISQKVADYLGVKVIYKRDGANFDEVVEQLRTGEVDAIIGNLSITPKRMAIVRYSKPYLQLKQALLVNRYWLAKNKTGNSPGEAIRNFKGKLAFVKGTSYETFAHLSFPNAQHEPVVKWKDIVEGVVNGTYDMAFRNEFEVKRVALEYPEAAIATKTILIKDKVDNIAAAVDYRNTALLDIINFAITSEFSNITVSNMVTRFKAEQSITSR
jgi:hypothetical protein